MIFFPNFVKTTTKMANGFHKYLGNEDKLQHSVMNFIEFQYPDALCVRTFPMKGGALHLSDLNSNILVVNREFQMY